MGTPSFLREREVLVTGAGVTGPATARALLAAGARVTVTDANQDRLRALAETVSGARVVHGIDAPPDGTDLVVTAPGWRPESPIFTAAEAAGIEVIGDVELAWRLCAERPDPPAWLVVTGTDGKTTTVTMLESILLAAGLDAVACGNIGLPVLDAIAAGHRVLAMELSSYQLYWSPSVHPAAGVVINIAADHLDWHGGMDAYAAAKSRALTGEIAIGGVDYERVATMLTEAPAPVKVGLTSGEPVPGQLGVTGGMLVDLAFADGLELIPVAEVRPEGPSGVADALAAAAVARAYGVSAEAIAAGLRGFQPIAHRAEAIAEIGGVCYVNDSKATNPHAAASSLRGYEHVVWIAGGLLKGASVDELVTETAARLAGVVLLGADREVIATALARHAPDVPVRTVSAGEHGAMAVMSEAVRLAGALARPGDTVLLAPAAASMDMFTDYQHRGRAFTEAVLALPAPGAP